MREEEWIEPLDGPGATDVRKKVVQARHWSSFGERQEMNEKGIPSALDQAPGHGRYNPRMGRIMTGFTGDSVDSHSGTRGESEYGRNRYSL